MEVEQVDAVGSAATLSCEVAPMLKAQVVDEILGRLARGSSVKRLALEYGVDRKTIRAWRARAGSDRAGHVEIRPSRPAGALMVERAVAPGVSAIALTSEGQQEVLRRDVGHSSRRYRPPPAGRPSASPFCVDRRGLTRTHQGLHEITPCKFRARRHLHAIRVGALGTGQQRLVRGWHQTEDRTLLLLGSRRPRDGGSEVRGEGRREDSEQGHEEGQGEQGEEESPETPPVDRGEAPQERQEEGPRKAELRTAAPAVTTRPPKFSASRARRRDSSTGSPAPASSHRR